MFGLFWLSVLSYRDLNTKFLNSIILCNFNFFHWDLVGRSRSVIKENHICRKIDESIIHSFMAILVPLLPLLEWTGVCSNPRLLNLGNFSIANPVEKSMYVVLEKQLVGLKKCEKIQSFVTYNHDCNTVKKVCFFDFFARSKKYRKP